MTARDPVVIDQGIRTVRQMPCSYKSTRCAYCCARISLGETIDWTPDRPQGERAKHPGCPWPIIAPVGQEMVEQQARDLARRHLATVIVRLSRSLPVPSDVRDRILDELVAVAQQVVAEPAAQHGDAIADDGRHGAGRVIRGPWPCARERA